MTRSILSGLLALVSVGALGVLPVACQSGGVGDPCTPEAEYDAQFPGFRVAQEFIESRSFQCATRICLVNHFQGRVSCPYGQAVNNMKPCSGEDDTSCGAGVECRPSQTLAPDCACDASKPGDCAAPDKCGVQGLVCDAKLKICTCTPSDTPGSQYTDAGGTSYYCVNADSSCKKNCTQVLKAYTCHKPNDCQTSDPSDAKNNGKRCCVPGTDTPVTVPVCGQCSSASHRNADDAVYCSCRCCPKCCDDPDLSPEDKAAGRCADDNCGTKCDPNFNYCSCPTGFECSEIRKNVGLGDAQLTGSYCIKEATKFKGSSICGEVKGVVGETCEGTAAANVAAP